MDRCPPEICSEIYSFACLDDGKTGRSLSLVSKFTNETSKPYKLQSISLIGHAQLYAFADLVERTPEHLRRVKSLFVSAHSRETAILPRAIAPEYHRRTEVYAAFKRILDAIAPSVQIIHVFFVFFRPFVLLPIGLPHLEELVIHGSLEPSTTLVDKNAQFPSLKHLWLTSSGSPAFLLQKVLPLAPALHHLRLSEIKSEVHAEEWKLVRTDPHFSLPPHLRRVLIHEPTEPSKPGRRVVYDVVMAELRELAKHDDRVVLLPPFKLDMFSMVELQEAESTYTPDKNLVTASFEFPGLKKDDVQIDVNNGHLTVSAETKQSSDYEEGAYAVRERRYGQFSRTLQLPEGIKAAMDNGVLTVTFPRSTPEKAPKRISIS